ncbi:hypothetical protein CUU66_16060 [Peribacillus deserti]|uniref:Uncharacterized protein n=2 Tax=Peribacillus deserti TaxID=673318 RepID=A0A2N5M3B8_9BACI|nr:hypothetical protein CUU66_16060 [Peribacillus deserti]
MCGIEFVITNTFKEAAKTEEKVMFDEHLYFYLSNAEKYTDTFSLLLNSDLYGETFLGFSEVTKLREECEGILKKYRGIDHRASEIRHFAQSLIILCKEAIKRKKNVFALGD